MIRLLYKASQAGVRCGPDRAGDVPAAHRCVPWSATQLHVRSIVGRFLEHSRLYWFANGGVEELFIGSADLMDATGAPDRGAGARQRTPIPRAHLRHVGARRVLCATNHRANGTGPGGPLPATARPATRALQRAGVVWSSSTRAPPRLSASEGAPVPGLRPHKNQTSPLRRRVNTSTPTRKDHHGATNRMAIESEPRRPRAERPQQRNHHARQRARIRQNQAGRDADRVDRQRETHALMVSLMEC